MPVSFLEDFESAGPERDRGPRMVPEPELEAARQAGFDAGYRSGWNAAAAAAEEDQARIRADFARSLQTLGFTYQEARAHVMRGIEPLLDEMLRAVFPATMLEAMGATILQDLCALAEDAADVPIAVAVAPSDADGLRAILGENTPLPLTIVEDATLADGQAYLRLGAAEKIIDLAGVIARMTNALGALSESNERILAHG